MVSSVEQFGHVLVASGVLGDGDLRRLLDELEPTQRPTDDKSLAALLVEKQLLNDFQAQRLLSGDRSPLVLGDYVLLGKIGAGGMGQVFKAKHRVMERIVAIKLLPPTLTHDESAILRFRQEVKAAARLTHPNIVHAYDAGVQEGLWFLVMEYVEGRDLSAVGRDRGPLPLADAVGYVLQAARGLEYAHGEGVVHRDIKPSNLLLDKRGTVKVLDMGLARIESADHQLTGTREVMGTVDFLPPEQALNTRSADARSDIYSLGCTLYRLLTSRSVYAGESAIEIIMAHRRSPIPSLRARRPDAPEELERIFAKAVAKQPAERFQSAGELVAALETFVAAGLPKSSTNITAGSTESPDTFKLPSDPDDRSRIDTTSFNQPDAATSSFAPQTGPSDGPDHRRTTTLGLGGVGLALALLLAIWFATRGGENRVVVLPNDAQATTTELGSIGNPPPLVEPTPIASPTSRGVAPGAESWHTPMPGQRVVPLPHGAGRLAATREGLAVATGLTISFHRFDDLLREWSTLVEGVPVFMTASRDGSRIAAMVWPGDGRRQCMVLDRKDGAILKTIPLQESGMSLAYSHDDRMLALGLAGGKVLLYDAVDLRPVKTLEGGSSPISALAFSPDDRRLSASLSAPLGSSGSVKRTFEMWNVESGERVDVVEDANPATGRSVMYSRDGRQIYQTLKYRGVLVRDAADGRVLGNIEGTAISFPPLGVALSTQDRVITCGRVISLADPIGRRTEKMLATLPKDVMDLALSPDDRYLCVTANSSRELFIQDLTELLNAGTKQPAAAPMATGTASPPLAKPTATRSAGAPLAGRRSIPLPGQPQLIAVGGDGKHVAVVTSQNGTELHWIEIATGKSIWRMPVNYTVVSLGVAPIGNRLAMLASQRNVSNGIDFSGRLIDMSTQTFAGNFPLAEPSRGLKFSRDGKVLAIGGVSGKISLFDGETLAPLREVAGTDTIAVINFSADGSQLAASFQARQPSNPQGPLTATFKRWNVATGAPLPPIDDPEPSSAASLAFSNDGDWLLVGTFNPGAQLWNLKTGRPAAVVPRSRSTGAVFVEVLRSRDVACVAGLTMSLVNLPNCSILREVAKLPRPASGFAVTPDDRYALTIHQQMDEVLVWDLAEPTADGK